MNKTDKELAVDVAIAYINAAAQQHNDKGGSKGLYELKTIEDLIQRVYKILSNLDDTI